MTIYHGCTDDCCTGEELDLCCSEECICLA
jgi:hypothetical protein